MLTGSRPRPSHGSTPASPPSGPALAPVGGEHEDAELTPPGRFRDVARLRSELRTLNARMSALSRFRDRVALESDLDQMQRRLAAISWDPSRNARR